jgi:hypothetical protein
VRAPGQCAEDPVAGISLALAGILGASVQGRVALGARAGAPVLRLGDGVRQARVLYHGVLAPHARWRAEVVAYRRAERTEAAEPSEMGTSIWMRDSGAERRRHWTWAALMRRAFDLDVLRCPRCAGRMQLIATIDDPAIIQSRRRLSWMSRNG